jgi:hypothetical protein
MIGRRSADPQALAAAALDLLADGVLVVCDGVVIVAARWRSSRPTPPPVAAGGGW